jgi:type II secretory pathway component PulM
MTIVGSSGADTLLGAVAVTLLVLMYGQWLYRSRRLRRCQERLRSRVAVVRELIADGERTKTAYADTSDPSSAHGNFLQRCDSSLRKQFGDSFARRIDAYSEFEWIQPASLISDEQVFAWYDTERRLKGLRELLHEALIDLASLDE